MLFKSIFLFASTAFAAAISTPTITADDVLTDLRALDASINTLNKAMGNYSGGVLEAAPILAGLARVHRANRKAFNDGSAASTVAAVDGQKIISYVSNPIAIDIPNTVATTKAKKALFKKSGLTSSIVAGMKLLEKDHDSLSSVLSSRLPNKALVAQANVPVKLIHESIQGAIDFFSS
jgi:Hydrophobic surface binding protein A